MTAEMMMLLGGVTAFGFTLHLVRLRQLRVKYAMVWLSLAGALLVIGAFPQILMSFADWARMSYPAAVLFISLGMMYLFSFSVSMSLSRAHQRTTRLLQEAALLEERIRNLEQEKKNCPDERTRSTENRPDLEQ